jgi:ribosomal protein S18 acetylase RimI-like enzyme
MPDDTFIAPLRRPADVDLQMRRARRADLKAILAATAQTVWDDIPEDERARLVRPEWEKHLRKKIEPFLDASRIESWVAEAPAGTLLGYIVVGPGGGFLTPESCGFIFDVWVAPDHRGTGIGKSLVTWAIDWARSRGYRKIKLEVAESNPRARRLYEELGFRPERHHLGKVLE